MNLGFHLRRRPLLGPFCEAFATASDRLLQAAPARYRRSVWIALIVCSTFLAAFVFQTWTNWRRWRFQRRVDLVEELLALCAGETYGVLDAVDLLADIGPGYFSRTAVRQQVLKARIELHMADVARRQEQLAKTRSAARELL